jgi:hypothetical protein
LGNASPAKIMTRREYDRIPVQARARIRIGNRSYAGWIEDISEGGARIVTLTPIRDHGRVLITVPDLKSLGGDLRWSDGCAGGVQFRLKLDPGLLYQWLSLRIRRAA